MKKIVIQGGKRLSGEVEISGSKNAALPILAASLLTEEEVILHNVPRLGDVEIMASLIDSLGGNVQFKDGTIQLKPSRLSARKLSDNDLTGQIRYSVHLVGALLPRFKEVRISLPGGCVIGTRRLDSHIYGLKKLGAAVEFAEGYLKATTCKLQGSYMKLEYPSVGATENIMLAACLAEGSSVVENVAMEPEIVDLANFLNSMGANVKGAGTNAIRINGVDKLHGTEHKIMPDRIETGTYMVGAAITGGDVLLKNTDIHLLYDVVSKVHEMGVHIEECREGLHISGSDRLKGTDIITEVYPGFPTDMQPIITPLLSLAKGKSRVKETIFDNRFNHVPELLKMGARIEKVDQNTLLISGVDGLKGTEVAAADIRSGGSLILAGLAAEGRTAIDGVNQILRGYERPLEKFRMLGAELDLSET